MRLYVSLRPAEAARLSELAQRERRDPRDQAAYLIARALATVEQAVEPGKQPAEAVR